MLLHEWVNTLPEHQRTEFNEAQQRQLEIRESKISDGALEVNGIGTPDNEYIWKDEKTAQINKPYDKVWRAYFDRYLVETQTIFEMIEETLDGEK